MFGTDKVVFRVEGEGVHRQCLLAWRWTSEKRRNEEFSSAFTGHKSNRKLHKISIALPSIAGIASLAPHDAMPRPANIRLRSPVGRLARGAHASASLG